MSTFCDSSALVKLYAYESGSEIIRALPEFVVSQLARVEVPAALWRKSRSGELEAREARTVVAAFENDLIVAQRFVVVALTDEVLDFAARSLARHSLRAYDAVQLACAVAARQVDPGLTSFASFDRELDDAAAAEGFALVR